MIRIFLAVIVAYLVINQHLSADMYMDWAASFIIAFLALPMFQRLLD